MIPRGLKKEQKEELESGEKILAWLEEGKDVRFGEWGLRWVGGGECWQGWQGSVAVPCAAAVMSQVPVRCGGKSCWQSWQSGSMLQQ